MGNGRKQTALWLVFVEGAALSLGIYLLLTVLLSALVVKAVLPEEGAFPLWRRRAVWRPSPGPCSASAAPPGAAWPAPW